MLALERNASNEAHRIDTDKEKLRGGLLVITRKREIVVFL